MFIEPIARLTHSMYTTKIARIRCYTMASTICKCQDVQHTISDTDNIVALEGESVRTRHTSARNAVPSRVPGSLGRGHAVSSGARELAGPGAVCGFFSTR